MADTTYAVYTATCTYLLDDDGICQSTHASLPDAERCVGAQFVACLDLRAEGGLVGELRLGAAALFARQEGGRFVLLRTLPIEHVEIRAPVEDPHSFAETPVFASAHAGGNEGAPLPSFELGVALPPPPLPPLDPETEPFPAFAFNPEETEILDPRWSTPGEVLDLEDMLSISVAEVTVSLPLYRPPPVAAPPPPPRPPPRPPPHAPPRRNVVGPGRRIR